MYAENGEINENEHPMLRNGINYDCINTNSTQFKGCICDQNVLHIENMTVDVRHETEITLEVENEKMTDDGSLRHVTWGPDQEFIFNLPSLEEEDESTSNEVYDEIISINIAGELFQTYKRTLEQYPETLLGDNKKRNRYLNSKTGEYFFDRPSEAFDSILYFYQSGEIYIPTEVALDRFIQELIFFRLGENVIEKVEIDSGMIEADMPTIELPDFYPFKVLWNFLEYPDTSQAAKTFGILSVIVIIFSTVLFVIETIPEFSSESNEAPFKNVSKKAAVVSNSSNSSTRKMTSYRIPVPNKHAYWMFVGNTVAIAWFTTEIVLRLISCPNKIKFLLNAMNIIDILSVLPYYLTLALNSSNGRLLSVIRVIRVLRILKLSRHSSGLQVLGKTLSASREEMGMLGFLVTILVLMYSSILYFAESQMKDSEFVSIPHTTWWAIVTLTTVGYGDLTPKTTIGKMVACIALVSGVIVMSLPVPSVCSNFTYYYNIEKNRASIDAAKETRTNKSTEKVLSHDSTGKVPSQDDADISPSVYI